MTARRWELPAAVIAGVVVRYPFWREALKTPVDGDTAIIGLMARHPLRSVTMWGQPYGSPLEAWLAAPLMALLRPDAATLRLAYFLLGLMFSSIYAAIDSFSHTPFFGRPVAPSVYSYFSFVTLTTLGFGDYTPATDAGRRIVVIEAVAGQVFIATTLARLVSLCRSRPADER